MKRANYLGVPQVYNLNHACEAIFSAFGNVPYLVGSSLIKKDYRDVDVRLILDDEEFDILFPGIGSRHDLNAKWSLMCASISGWLASRSSLPVDFQIQRQTEANNDYPNEPRHALGVFHK